MSAGQVSSASPGATDLRVEIAAVYDRDEAYEVIHCSRLDYENHFAALKARILASA